EVQADFRRHRLYGLAGAVQAYAVPGSRRLLAPPDSALRWYYELVSGDAGTGALPDSTALRSQNHCWPFLSRNGSLGAVPVPPCRRRRVPHEETAVRARYSRVPVRSPRLLPRKGRRSATA